MKKEEFIKTIIYNNIKIDLGLDDYGQTYFIEYIDPITNNFVQECIGSYVTDYESFIEYRFGKPEINCPIYKTIKTTNKTKCEKQDKMFCTQCEKRFNKIEYKKYKKRQKDFSKTLKRYYHEKNIT